jgi:hypothetical protein
MTPIEPYYVRNKDKLLTGLTGSIIRDHIPKVLESCYGAERAASVLGGTDAKYEAYLPVLPYSGQEDLHDARDMVFAAWCLAFYRTMQEQGHSAEEAGKILYDATVNKMQTYPQFLLRLVGKLIFTPVFKWINKKHQEATHGRECAYCFISNYVEGDGQSFDFGKDFVQCGINKWFREQGAAEFLPYMCCLDYPLAKPLEIGFHRTTTLGIGGDRCDFRYKKGQETETGWPPKGT